MDATLDCSKVFVQVLNRAAGLAFRESDGYRFVAARRDLLLLEEQRWPELYELEKAATEIVGRTSNDLAER